MLRALSGASTPTAQQRLPHPAERLQTVQCQCAKTQMQGSFLTRFEKPCSPDIGASEHDNHLLRQSDGW
jgi:hypothetical protein